MSAVEELHSVTKELHYLVNKPFTEENRDEAINEIDRLLAKREQMLAQIKGPYSDEEQQLGKEIVGYNVEINKKLDLMKNNISADLQKISSRKITNNRYANPYESVNIDGMFLDKRK
jgi:flagellar protein FliT